MEPVKKVDCPTCKGSGAVADKDGKAVVCPTCKGTKAIAAPGGYLTK